jgi:hypothetical protein
MKHPHSDQRSRPVHQRPLALSPYTHLVNAPVSPLDCHTSALIPTRRKYPGSPLVVDGEVITSSLIVPAPPKNTNATAVPVIEPKPSVLRRATEDPYWILMTLMVAIGLAITATVIYGTVQIILAVAEWVSVNGTTIAVITTLIIVLAMCGGATAAKCAGIHCRGCRG